MALVIQSQDTTINKILPPAADPRVVRQRFKTKMTMKYYCLRIVLYLGVVFLAGCVPYPHNHLTMPHLIANFRDTNGRVITNAKFNIYSGSVISHRVDNKQSVKVDTNGIAEITQSKKIHWFYVPIPDGEAGWIWMWCASAPGYRPLTGRLFRETADTLNIVLRPDSTAVACPDSLQKFDELKGAY